MFTTLTSTVLRVENLHKNYGLRTVLDDVSLIVNAGERIGIVGANGVGKSTLLKIIAGEIAPDGGEVSLNPSLTAGYLQQTVRTEDNRTLRDLVDETLAEARALEMRLRELETQMASAAGEALAAIMSAYGDASDRFERIGGYDLDQRAEAILDGLGIGAIGWERPLISLSGGERARAALALLLLSAPDLLLMDEPTNHLDQKTLAWLESWLAAYRGTLMVVSHDRAFLNRVVTVIVEIDEHTHRTKRYNGSYDVYAAAKVTERRKWEADWQRQQDEIRQLKYEIKEGARRNNNYRAHTDNDKFVIHIKQQTHDATVSKRIRLAEEKLRRLEANLIPQPPEPLRFRGNLDPAGWKSRLPIVVERVSKRYNNRVILDEVSLSVAADSRIILIGENGAGKTTLLRLILGIETPDSGTIDVHAGARLGWLAQDRGTLSPHLTLFEAYRDGLPESDQQLKATLIKSGLFRYEDFGVRVGDLSAGQERKLQIARLIAARANVLVLDEPTNDVSFDVLESLEDALIAFPGAVIASAHDRRFVEKLAAQGAVVLEVRDGRLLNT